jgi:ATP-dependent DNA helicase PIF1
MNPEQQLALNDVLNGHSIFITGGAGVGKSYLVNKIVQATSHKNVGVCAMTGCAALLINGSTIHSYLAIGLARESAKDLAKRVRSFTAVFQRLLKLNILLIDEVSMLNDELFEKISEFLQVLRRNTEPFGGVQMIFVGDPFQLAPVDGDYFFTSKLWTKNIKVHALSANMRQKGDDAFKGLLDRVRWGVCDERDLETLQKCRDTVFPSGIVPTRLYAKNINVDSINKREFDKLETDTYEHETWYLNEGSKKWATANKIPEKVHMRVGAQVMCTRNIPTLGVVNGSRGVITDLFQDSVTIRLLDGGFVRMGVVTVSPFDNPYIEVRYLPLKLAWAITIHSSQGMTIDALEVDLGPDIFTYGQAYTGLSRARSLSTVRVTNVVAKSFLTSSTVKRFFNICVQ